MVKRFFVKVPLPNGGHEERAAYVYLPKGYYKNEKKRYPVLYMFDGHNVFFDSDASYGKSWGMADYMDRTRTEMIIAAVECNHSPNHGRLQEYSPFTFRDPSVGLIAGRGRSTMNWFTKVFKPMIDKHFRTMPSREYTFIAGSSMGGLMSIYALLEYNHIFSRAAALSPSVWTAPDRLCHMIDHADVWPNTVLYMDYGTIEFGNHDEMTNTFGEIASRLISRKIALNCRIVPGGTHTEENWEKQIPHFMSTLLYQ